MLGLQAVDSLIRTLPCGEAAPIPQEVGQLLQQNFSYKNTGWLSPWQAEPEDVTQKEEKE